MDKHLHIICLDVPYPVNYGGVFDIFYKIKSLHREGIKIHLHCFEYGRGQQDELNTYCESVHYYKRRRGLRGLSTNLPYIVSSRRSSRLLQNLLEDSYPILMEGIHCTFLVTDKRFKDRQLVLRLHNVEFNYYRGLAQTTSSFLRRIYYLSESRALRKYEQRIAKKVMILSVSEQDVQTYKQEFAAEKIDFLPVFLPYGTVSSLEGTGSFCLYHGNLSVPENEKAVLWLLEQVFASLKIPFVIAGKNPSRALRKKLSQNSDCCLVANPSEKEMQDLVAKAQVNVLPSLNQTGVKLKLLNALFNGRHCVVNEAALLGTTLSKECHIAKGADSFRTIIRQLHGQPFTAADLNQRKMILGEMYDNQRNARQLIRWIW